MEKRYVFDRLIPIAWRGIVFVTVLVLIAPHARADCPLVQMGGTRPVGTVVFNTSCDVLQVCKPDNQWHALGAFTPGCGAPADTTPDAFSFTDQTGVATSTLIESNTVTITGIDTATNVGISGDGNPEFRIDGGSWVTSGTITNGQTLQLRLTSDGSGSATSSATVTVGTADDQWDVTTGSGGPTGCPSVGDLCYDGSYYIGQIGGNDIYATAAASQSSQTWNNGTTNWTVTGFTSTTDGDGNTAGLVALSDAGAPYDAAEYCDGLTNVHGNSDWYLPAKDELNLFYNGGSPVAGVNTSGSWYWSSSEFDEFDNKYYARVQRFSDGHQSIDLKDTSLLVRCVRR